MGDYVVVCKVDHIPLGQGRGFQVGDQRVAVFRVTGKDWLGRSQERYYAVANSCTHAYAPLANGPVRGCRVQCPLHGAWFDLKSGKALGPPASEPVKRFRVRVVGDEIQVEV